MINVTNFWDMIKLINVTKAEWKAERDKCTNKTQSILGKLMYESKRLKGWANWQGHNDHLVKEMHHLQRLGFFGLQWIGS